MILLTQEDDNLHSTPEETMEKYPFRHIVEFQHSAPHMGQEGQEENTAEEGRLGSLASSHHEPASWFPRLLALWRSSPEYTLRPDIQERGKLLPDGVPYRETLSSGRWQVPQRSLSHWVKQQRFHGVWGDSGH